MPDNGPSVPRREHSLDELAARARLSAAASQAKRRRAAERRARRRAGAVRLAIIAATAAPIVVGAVRAG